MSDELKVVSKGGIWSDENLEQPLDWAGDTGSIHASENERASHTPKTQRQIEKEILREASINDDVINIIVNRVALSVQQVQLTAIKEEIATMTRTSDEHRAVVDEWMKAQAKRQKESEERNKIDSSSDIRRLDEQLATLENKILELTRLITTRGAEEVMMIQEAHKIIKDRQAIEESEVASEPSVIGRMNDRMTNLTSILKGMEPDIEKAFSPSAVASSSSVAPKRVIVKKFGRM